MTHRFAFLDVDGVLNSEHWFHRRKGDPLWLAKEALDPKSEECGHLYDLLQLDPEACERLQAICQQTEVTAVLSSTWRLLGGYERNAPILSERGFTYPLEHMTPNLGPEWMTNYTRSESQRGLEIEQWLLKHVPLEELHDTRIVILDDDSDMDRLMPWLVKTSWKTGLTKDHFALVEEALTRPLGDLLDTPNPLWTPKAVEVLYP
jgi:hypothetical protein